jgi:ribonuclease J
MTDNLQNEPQNTSPDAVKFLALGGEEDVTRNMYIYEYKDEILIVDCGLGFPDETMLGVDLLLPDISYLLNTKKKIVGMVLTHGHEDHIGGLPFILPQLMESGNKFPIYGSPLTAALANEKLAEFGLERSIQTVEFGDNNERRMGGFKVGFIHITHSIPDSANLVINTPIGNFFHGSDFKFDLTPANGKRSEFNKMAKAAEEGIICLMSDCLGAERPGFTPSEEPLGKHFERELRNCKGKFIITTYSSNISRLNQAIAAAEKFNRKVCFVGRSFVNNKGIGQKLGYLKMRGNTEVSIDQLKNFRDDQLLLLVAGSQGQENSAMNRIANGEHREIKLSPDDVVIFSSDAIPGNEVAVSSLIDTLSKRGCRVAYSTLSGEFHVSGHGSAGDLQLLISLTKPTFLLPISGMYRHMVAYRDLAQKMGYRRNDVYLVENGQEMLFTKNTVRFGQRIEVKNVYVDEVSGEEVENFVVRDRERLAKEGVILVLAEIKTSDGQLFSKPEIISRGSSITDTRDISASLTPELERALSKHKERVNNWVQLRRLIGKTTEQHIYRKFRMHPLIMPVIIEI